MRALLKRKVASGEKETTIKYIRREPVIVTSHQATSSKKLTTFNEWFLVYSYVQSTYSKHRELQTFVQVSNPSIILLSETWFHPGIPDSVVLIPNYVLYRSDSVTIV